MMQGQPVIILREGTERSKGKGAQSNNIAAARAVADAVRSTLGPKGMDKMLVDSMGDVTITNDGVTILKEIEVEHPAAKMLVEVAKTQDDEVGDGTTTAVILAGELLKKAEDLVEQNVHPTIIVNGYKIAAEKAIELLSESAFPVDRGDTALLKQIAATAMSGRSVGTSRNFLAEIAVKAVKSIAEEVAGKIVADVDNVLVVKKHGGALSDTQLVDGIILDKERVHPRMPAFVREAKIALLNRALEIKKTEFSSEIRIHDAAKMQAFLSQEEATLKGYVDAIKKAGANVVIGQKGIDDLVQHYLAKEGIYAVRRAKESDMKKLAKATGGKIVVDLNDLSSKDLGHADLVEERKIGDDEMTFVTGCRRAKAVSILIRGGTEHVVDEVERIVHDALRVVAAAIEDGLALPGGGASDIELSLRLKEFAPSVGGREQLAIEAFAEALEVVPWTLAENAGLDAIDLLIALRTRHEGKKGKNIGVDLSKGEPADMLEAKVIEPLRVKRQAIESASEVANMILRIDDVIAAKKMSGGGAPGGEGHEHGGMGGMGGMPPGMGM
ncbi:MAG TPA: thermosome subunit beta [Thermoplasmata archaeon]|nr:thermosome subunit beta [Thermoplasmata archaeon]